MAGASTLSRARSSATTCTAPAVPVRGSTAGSGPEIPRSSTCRSRTTLRASDSIRLTANPSSQFFTVRYVSGYYDITAAVTGAGVVLRNLAPGQVKSIGVRVDVAANAPPEVVDGAGLRLHLDDRWCPRRSRRARLDPFSLTPNLTAGVVPGPVGQPTWGCAWSEWRG